MRFFVLWVLWVLVALVSWTGLNLAAVYQKGTNGKETYDSSRRIEEPSEVPNAPKAEFIPISVAKTKYIPQYERYKHEDSPLPTIRFGLERTELNMEDPGFRHYPILVRNGQEIRFESPIYHGHSWALVVSSEEGSRVFGVLEHDIAGPAHELLLVASTDGGLNWYHAANIKKPNYLARIKSLGFSKDGEGTLVVRLENYGSPPGDYIYSSSDWGRTWSKPVFRTDIMYSAEKIE